jgi:hypothetical protein
LAGWFKPTQLRAAAGTVFPSLGDEEENISNGYANEKVTMPVKPLLTVNQGL